jgi:hypothetical protein
MPEQQPGLEEVHFQYPVVIQEDENERFYHYRTMATKHLQASVLHYLHFGLWARKIKQEIPADLYGFDTFEALCFAPMESGGFGLRSNEVYHAIRVVEKFVLELHTSPEFLALCSKSNLKLLQPHINAGNRGEALADAQVCTVKDLQQNIKDGKYSGGVIDFDPEKEPEIDTQTKLERDQLLMDLISDLEAWNDGRVHKNWFHPGCPKTLRLIAYLKTTGGSSV